MEEKQYVVFQLGQEEYGIEITSVQEIIRPPVITQVPTTPAHVLGITNLRDNIIPLVDLKKRFDLVSSEDNDNTRMIIIKMDNHMLGIKVDKVLEVVQISNDKVKVSDDIYTEINKKFIRGIARLENRIVILLDLSSVI